MDSEKRLAASAALANVIELGKLSRQYREEFLVVQENLKAKKRACQSILKEYETAMRALEAAAAAASEEEQSCDSKPHRRSGSARSEKHRT